MRLRPVLNAEPEQNDFHLSESHLDGGGFFVEVLPSPQIAAHEEIAPGIFGDRHRGFISVERRRDGKGGAAAEESRCLLRHPIGDGVLGIESTHKLYPAKSLMLLKDPSPDSEIAVKRV